MSKKISWLTLILILIIQGYAWAETDLTISLEQADQLYREFIQTDNATLIDTAKSIFDNLLVTYPDHPEIYWRTARCYNEYASISDDPVAIFETAIEYAKCSLELEDSAEAHFWLAVLYGQIGQAKGILKSLFMVKPIHEELKTCISLDPTYDFAYHVLAKLYLKVPGKPLSIGDKRKALEYELQAVQLNPNHFPYQWGLYQIYRKLHMQQEAIQVLQTILSLPLEYEFDHVYREEFTSQEIKNLAAQELHGTDGQ